MNLKNLLSWSEKEFSHLPWRGERSLYRTLVSEIMLQQTTVSTVKNHFEKFIQKFPDLQKLSSASEEELLIAWKGLGYYRRARNLAKIAKSLVENFDGMIPNDQEQLLKIPGIGPYTANALIGIGLDKRALAVDANLERVIARLLNLKIPKGIKLQKEILSLFANKEIFHQKVSFRKLNEALMDLGRTYCQARKVSCDLCPLKMDCIAFQKGNPLKIPLSDVIQNKEKNLEELHLLRIIVLKNKKLLVYKKNSQEWLSGQYEVPTFILSTTDPKINQYPRLEYQLKTNFSFKTSITKYKIKNSVAVMTDKEFSKITFPKKIEWREINQEQSNFSTATLKILKHSLLMDLNKSLKNRDQE